MAEKILVQKPITISFSGLFDFKEFMKLIHDYLTSKNYTLSETMTSEDLTSSGKIITIKDEPYLNISDYSKIIMEYNIKAKVLKVKVEKDNNIHMLHKGNVEISFKSYIQTDTGNKFLDKPHNVFKSYLKDNPILFFFRILFNKYIWQDEMKEQVSKAKKDIFELKDKLHTYFNLYKIYNEN